MSILKKEPYVHIYTRNKGVTGSCMLVTVHLSNKKNIRFLVDCGSFQGLENDEKILNEMVPFNTEKIDFVLVTHTHMDHVGLLPLLVKQGYCRNIFMSAPTFNLIDIPLNDAYKIQSRYTDSVPIYNRNHLDKTYSLMIGVPFDKTIKPVKDVQVTFKPNGHLIGASLIEVVINDPIGDEIRLQFVGDYKKENIFFDTNSLTGTTKPYSAVICESTYGSVDSTDSMFEPSILQNVTKALKSGRNVIVPSFGIGKTQELLYLFKCGQSQHLFPKDTIFYLVGGTAQQVTQRYLYANLGIKKEMRDFLPSNLQIIRGKQSLAKINNIFNDPNPNVIIGPSGMADKGGIKNFTKQAISRTDTFIQITGYCSPDSMASKILNTSNGETISWKGTPLVKKCDVAISRELSLHSKRDELKDLLTNKSPSKSILITHGEPVVRKDFAHYLRANDVQSQIGILNPDYVFEIDANGIRDSF